MICNKCKSNNDGNSKFCSNCGEHIDQIQDDLLCVTKIHTGLYILFDILTLGIYRIVKMYRMTGDLRKIIPRELTVSPMVITAYIATCIIMIQIDSININNLNTDMYMRISFISGMISAICILLYCHIVYHTLKNIALIAEIEQSKGFSYNKFWAFIFGFIYINFVFNTYNERLIDINK